MKKNYFLERTPQPKGGTQLVHAEGCDEMPRNKREVSLIGKFSKPYPALAEARRVTLRADACRHCCREFLTREQSIIQ